MKGMSPDSLNDAVTEAVRNLRSPVFFCFSLNAICNAALKIKSFILLKTEYWEELIVYFVDNLI